MASWVTKAFINDALAARDAVALANLIGDGELAPEVREHLADIIVGLLTGKIKFTKRRPPKRGLHWQKQNIAEAVWNAKKRNGWKKISSAISYVAKELKLSERTVWGCWKVFDAFRYEIRREKIELDAMLDDGHTARWEAAVEWLTETEGADRQFTDEEIEAAAERLDEDIADAARDAGYY